MGIERLDFKELLEEDEKYEAFESNQIQQDFEEVLDETTPFERKVQSQIDQSSKFSIIADEINFQQKSRISKFSDISLKHPKSNLFYDNLLEKEFYNNTLNNVELTGSIYEYVRERDHIEPILINALISLYLTTHTLEELNNLTNYPFDVFAEKLYLDKVYDLNAVIFDALEDNIPISVKIEQNRYVKVINELVSPKNSNITKIHGSGNDLYSLISDLTLTNIRKLLSYPLQFLCLYYRLIDILNFNIDIVVAYNWYRNKELDKLHTNIFELKMLDVLASNCEYFNKDILYSSKEHRFYSEIGNNVIDYADLLEIYGQISYIENLDLYVFDKDVIEEAKKLQKEIKEKYDIETPNVIARVLIEHIIEYQNYTTNIGESPIECLYLTKLELLKLIINYYAFSNAGKALNLKTLEFEDGVGEYKQKVEQVDVYSDQVLNSIPIELRNVTNERLVFLMYRFLVNNDDQPERWRKALVRSYRRNIVSRHNLLAFLKSIESDYFEYSKLPANTNIFDLV